MEGAGCHGARCHGASARRYAARRNVRNWHRTSTPIRAPSHPGTWHVAPYNPAVTQASQLSPELAQGLLQLEVLNEPDELTKDEFQIMKRHVVDGCDA